LGTIAKEWLGRLAPALLCTLLMIQVLFDFLAKAWNAWGDGGREATGNRLRHPELRKLCLRKKARDHTKYCGGCRRFRTA